LRANEKKKEERRNRKQIGRGSEQSETT
jgi:hypothetical protein